MVRTYQITMGRAYYKCTLGLSSTSNVTDTEFTATPTMFHQIIYHAYQTKQYLYAARLTWSC